MYNNWAIRIYPKIETEDTEPSWEEFETFLEADTRARELRRQGAKVTVYEAL